MIRFLVLALILVSQSASAAPCCAGSSALSSLITGDEARFFGLSVSAGTVIGQAYGAGSGIPEFKDASSNQENRRNISLNFATLISDRWQLGASIPFVQNQLTAGSKSETNSRFGDISATIGFEVLPEWEYSEWKPRVFTFLQYVSPSGRSMLESKTALASDVSGLGMHQFHLGAVAIKRWSDWDANLVLKIGHEWSHESSLVNASMGAGYSFAEVWRAGMSLETQYQSPQKVSDALSSSYTSQKLVWNTGASITYLVGADSSLVAGYLDQTLFGPAINTTLARTLSLSFQRRWER